MASLVPLVGLTKGEHRGEKVMGFPAVALHSPSSPQAVRVEHGEVTSGGQKTSRGLVEVGPAPVEVDGGFSLSPGVGVSENMSPRDCLGKRLKDVGRGQGLGDTFSILRGGVEGLGGLGAGADGAFCGRVGLESVSPRSDTPLSPAPPTLVGGDPGRRDMVAEVGPKSPGDLGTTLFSPKLRAQREGPKNLLVYLSLCRGKPWKKCRMISGRGLVLHLPLPTVHKPPLCFHLRIPKVKDSLGQRR